MVSAYSLLTGLSERPVHARGGAALRFAFAAFATVGVLVCATALPAMAQHQGHSPGGTHAGGSHSDGGHVEGEGHSGRRGKGRGPGGGSGSAGARPGHGSAMKDKIFRAEPSPLGGHAQGAGARPTGAGGRGGRPAWAGGAIPETVELGRLNVARAPDQVLDRALNEAYASKLDKNGDGALDVDADLHAIESPLAALGLYREAMVGIRMVGGAWSLQDAALFLGKAADKNIRITPDTVQALGILLEVERDLSNFSYDRSAVYPAAIGTVFGGLGFSGTGATAFAQAADDARAIVQFEHDHGH